MPENPERSAEDLWAALSFTALLALSVLMSYVLFFTTPAPGSFGVPHPDFGTMLRGGSGLERHGPLLWMAWAIGAAEILLFGALMALGARRGPSLGGESSRTGLRGLGGPLIVGVALTLGVWTLLMVSYALFLDDPDPALYFALPAPTATMLYLLWGAPLIFAVLYVVGFRRWVFSEADEQAFAELVARRQARDSGERGGDG